MCIAVSLPGNCNVSADLVTVDVIECALFRSADRKALISFDVFVHNRSTKPVDVMVTHLDTLNVVLLATDDYVQKAISEEFANDERVELVTAVFGSAFHFNQHSGVVQFSDPSNEDFKPDEQWTIVAKPLVFDLKANRPCFTIDKSCVSYDEGKVKEYLPRDREGALPAQCLNDSLVSFLTDSTVRVPNRRPFSSFRIGPIVPISEAGCSSFFRVTIELKDDTYRRLVAPSETAPFEMTSAKRVIQTIQRYFEREPCREVDKTVHQGCYRFFINNIEHSQVSHNSYQIIIGQPQWESEQYRGVEQRNKLVRIRPTSSNVTERYIDNAAVRGTARWFHSWGPDFSLVLRYEDVPERPAPEVLTSRRPLASTVSVADPSYAVEIGK